MEKVTIFDTGYFYADGGAMFGAVPKMAWNRKYASDDLNGCILAMRSMWIETDGRRILIDTGAGSKHLKSLSYYRFFGMKDIREELRAQGIEPESITDVVLTHLHFDHCGGCTFRDDRVQLQLSFPNATHWVSERQWMNFRHPHPLERDSFFLEDMEPIEKAGKLKFVGQAQTLSPGVSLRLADGHTPGQIVPYVETDTETIVFAGDVIPLFASLSPEWISAYDLSPTVSFDEKIKLLDEAVLHHQRIVYCHDAYTLSSRAKRTASGLFLPERESIVHTAPPL